MKTKAFLTIGLISLFVSGLASTAGASTLKDVNGKAVETGSVVTLTAATLTSTYPGTSSSTVCNNVVLRYEVAQNGPEKVSLFPGTITRGTCLLKPANSPVYLISAMLYSPIELSAGKGTGSFSFKEKLEGAIPLTCTFTGTFNFTYKAESSVLGVPGSTLSGEGAGCPTSEVVQGEFALTNNLGKVTIS